MKLIGAIVTAAALCGGMWAQGNPALERSRWRAQWIEAAGAPAREFGVYHFRRVIRLGQAPAAFVVHVSGDNRYELLVNGERAADGPARGDLKHWRYETVDLAPHMHAGVNVLAAVVWNFADEAPQAQISNRTGFLLEGDGEAGRDADTGTAWKAVRDEAYSMIPVSMGELRGYFVAGPGERLDGRKYPWGWETAQFDDSSWPAAHALGPGFGRDAQDAGNAWMLVSRGIPAMEETPERIGRLREATGEAPPAGFPERAVPWTIPAHSRARVILDQTHLTTAYPELKVSGGKGALVRLGYAESMMLPGDYRGGWRKGNRDETKGKRFIGYHDEFIAGGGDGVVFRPLWWRTWRYMEVSVETAAEPLRIEDLTSRFTAYPFERRARFDAGNEELGAMLDIGWRTARLCAHETYMDCPYYEQLQYAGDTRIQAMVSLYMTGDARLARNAISQLFDSRTSEGATESRWPTRLQQYIPPFSLWWIGMVHDYWMYHGDPEFVRQMMPGVRGVLSFFAARQRSDGLLGGLPWWNFVDWADRWRSGVPPSGGDEAPAAVDLQLALGYAWAADMEQALGSAALAGEYGQAAVRMREAVRERYWDGARGVYADRADKSAVSQQTNTLAVLAGLEKGEKATALMEKVLEGVGMTPCSLYFRYYMNRAAAEAGLGDRYLELLEPWRRMRKLGLTTWPETEGETRSDCHAWSASPNIELFRTVLGVDTAAPGFSRVKIEPHLGPLQAASGAVPIPAGMVEVRLRRSGKQGLTAEVTLPAGVSGDIVWQGKSRTLAAGTARLSF